MFGSIALANLHPRINILNPGPGVGGHCIAVDPWFIISQHRDRSELIQTARQTNLKRRLGGRKDNIRDRKLLW